MRRDAVVLTDAETRLLGMRLCAHRIARPTDWLEWEDVPYLDEAGVERLEQAVTDFAAFLDREMTRVAISLDVDPEEVWERVT